MADVNDVSISIVAWPDLMDVKVESADSAPAVVEPNALG